MARSLYKVCTADDTDTGFKQVTGYSAQEVNAVPAATAIYLQNGQDGDKVVRIELAANSSETVAFSEPLLFTNKCFVTLTAGTGEVTVWGNP